MTGGARPGSVSLARDGFVGGGQTGYNWQTSPNFVFGLEADIQYTDFNRSTTVVTVPLAGAGTLANTFNSRMEYFGTFRGRLGYTWGATMLYATGGLAYGDVDNSASFNGTLGNVQSPAATAASTPATRSAAASSTCSRRTGA